MFFSVFRENKAWQCVLSKWLTENVKTNFIWKKKKKKKIVYFNFAYHLNLINEIVFLCFSKNRALFIHVVWSIITEYIVCHFIRIIS